ncbi:MAG: hypothetical protein ACYSYU_03855 [Planctomycetota bacterium]|jgi:hypothetical protein
MDWIQGDKFIEIADFCYAPPARARDDYNKLINTLDEPRGIIYTHTMYVSGLFDTIKQGGEVVVVTHNSDDSARITPPDNVVRWYSQNVDIVHPRVESIPIGIENNRWHPQKRGKMLRCLSEKRDYKNLVYINHSIRTNPLERALIYDMLEGKTWVSAARGRNGHGFDEYIKNIYNHKFVICPQGNGLDTHRTWECLYMGTIPVVRRDINNRFYTDLPICFVDLWEDITEDFLEKEYTKIKSQTWDLKKLNFAYWKNKITAHGDL